MASLTDLTAINTGVGNILGAQQLGTQYGRFESILPYTASTSNYFWTHDERSRPVRRAKTFAEELQMELDEFLEGVLRV